MLEECGRVIALEKDYALVEVVRKTACQSCSVNKGCGTGALSKVFGQRLNQLKVFNHINAQVGDSVVIGVEESALTKSALVVYTLPLLAMFLGAFLAQALVPEEVLAQSEAWVVLSSLLGLVLGFMWVRRFSHNSAADQRFQTVLLRHEMCLPTVVQFTK